MFIYFAHLPLLDMRERPTHSSPIVSQALFGEELSVQKKEGEWSLIQTPDGYSGWIAVEKFASRQTPYQPHLHIQRLKAHIYSAPDTKFGPVLSLPFGAPLEQVREVDARWLEVELPDGQRAYVQRGDVEKKPFDLKADCLQFLGLPYTWGGRSSFGFDCSGFVQMLYGQMGMVLPRDARLQFVDSRGKPVSLDELKLGDLLFWGVDETEIRHVGLFLGENQFIHTSSKENLPYLRISRLTDFEWSGQKGAGYLYRSARRFLG